VKTALTSETFLKPNCSYILMTTCLFFILRMIK